MNTLEINEYMRGIKSFKGTYPIDKIRKMKSPLSLVVNLDPHFMPGSHWVAIHINGKYAYYFDSFGRRYPDQIEKYLKKYKISKIKYNTRKFQSIDSKTCGAYTILFLKLMNNGFAFEEVLNLFSKDSKKNDDLSIRVLL